MAFLFSNWWVDATINKDNTSLLQNVFTLFVMSMQAYKLRYNFTNLTLMKKEMIIRLIKWQEK